MAGETQTIKQFWEFLHTPNPDCLDGDERPVPPIEVMQMLGMRIDPRKMVTCDCGCQIQAAQLVGVSEYKCEICGKIYRNPYLRPVVKARAV